MKIMVCGKGGSGKSSISSLLAKEYEKMGNKVLVVDYDESNFGLHRQLGVDLPKDFTLYFGSKKGIYNNLDAGKTAFENKWSIDDIPSEHSSQKGNIKLVAIGKIHSANEGCACAMGTVAKEFIKNIELKENEILICDSEAGVEHFGRGVDTSVDSILMVLDPSFESLELSSKVYKMAKDLDKKIYFVINKSNSCQYDIIKEKMENKDSVIGYIPVYEDILMSGLKGEPIKYSGNEIRDIINKLLI